MAPRQTYHPGVKHNTETACPDTMELHPFLCDAVVTLAYIRFSVLSNFVIFGSLNTIVCVFASISTPTFRTTNGFPDLS